MDFSLLSVSDKRKAYKKAYESLPESERIVIKEVVDDLVHYVKTHTSKVNFGFEQGLEVVAETGIWKIKQEKGDTNG